MYINSKYETVFDRVSDLAAKGLFAIYMLGIAWAVITNNACRPCRHVARSAAGMFFRGNSLVACRIHSDIYCRSAGWRFIGCNNIY